MMRIMRKKQNRFRVGSMGFRPSSPRSPRRRVGAARRLDDVSRGKNLGGGDEPGSRGSIPTERSRAVSRTFRLNVSAGAP